ncbi:MULTISPECIES: DJ-1/PfpI family protein [unclassified Duganella]|uniref:DJ-1/PfpI family protein n=1 Tax=unclassified Duganella TaxID=2636909 RepID=UPI000E34368E|nr:MULTISPECIES: DJ-1/PfpI family protein [unclassified Duganella]RFP13582.1 DJ-1/PfpI family protein [Duganella sp. BJB475]RFP36291.1 DJ-1/PfpI family protein [Duganella sp. BJB476]
MKTLRALRLFVGMLCLAACFAVSAHDMSSSGLRVAIVLFEGVEEIDYAGPMEVFGASGATVYTVGQTKSTVESIWGLKVTPDYDFADLPEVDVLLVPGGGIQNALKNAALLASIKARSAKVKVVMSVCSGAFILGKVGLLDGIAATTTVSMRPQLAKLFPATKVRDKRFVDAGKVVTTAGLTAGIDGALYVVERQSGRKRAESAAEYMEYDLKPAPK